MDDFSARTTTAERSDGEWSMSIVAEYLVDRPQYAAVIDDCPGMRLVVEGMTTSDCERLSVVFWADGGDFDTFEHGLERTAAISDVAIWSERTDSGKLYRICLPIERTDYRAWVARGGVVLDCTLDHEGMVVRMRFPDCEALVDYRNYRADHDGSFELYELTGTSGRPERHGTLTPPQRALLAAAVEGGYFEIPREITIAELATTFDISDQAASERLRRALSNVLGDVTLDRTASERIEAPINQ
jgi:hypothetical protein